MNLNLTVCMLGTWNLQLLTFTCYKCPGCVPPVTLKRPINSSSDDLICVWGGSAQRRFLSLHLGWFLASAKTDCNILRAVASAFPCPSLAIEYSAPTPTTICYRDCAFRRHLHCAHCTSDPSHPAEVWSNKLSLFLEFFPNFPKFYTSCFVLLFFSFAIKSVMEKWVGGRSGWGITTLQQADNKLPPTSTSPRSPPASFSDLP